MRSINTTISTLPSWGAVSKGFGALAALLLALLFLASNFAVSRAEGIQGEPGVNREVEHRFLLTRR